MWIRKFLKLTSEPGDAGSGISGNDGAASDHAAADGVQASVDVHAAQAADDQQNAGASVASQEASGEGLEPLPAEVVSGAEEAFTALGFPQDVMESARAWMEKGSDKTQAELDAIDAQDRAAAKAELQQLWGKSNYVRNIKAINKYISETLKPGVADVIQSARHADGHAIGNDPAVLQRLLGPALRAKPDDLTGDVDEQIEKIEAFMRTNRAAYNLDEPLQSRYRLLLEQRAEQT